MPWTFITYAVGMLALCGFPLFFSGFWSKDGILEAAQHWSVAKTPFYLLVFGALLTAFYMTRQVSYVFFGNYRGHKEAHESPPVMLLPLVILAFFAMGLGLVGTPAWPWFRAFLEGHAAGFSAAGFSEPGLLALMATSSIVVLLGLFVAWRIYGNKPIKAEDPDALEHAMPTIWTLLEGKFYIDEFYGATVIAFYAWWARVADWLDRRVWVGSWQVWRGSSAKALSWAGCSTSIGSTVALIRAARSWPVAADSCHASRADGCRSTCDCSHSRSCC